MSKFLVNENSHETRSTEEVDRFGNTFWAVEWGPGITQTVICATEAERDKVIASRSQVTETATPFCTFDDWRNNHRR
jgi:hypothetical protein